LVARDQISLEQAWSRSLENVTLATPVINLHKYSIKDRIENISCHYVHAMNLSLLYCKVAR